MKKKKELSLSLNKNKVSELNRSSQRQIQGGYPTVSVCMLCTDTNSPPISDC
ncbi:class I lanthipeptide [Ulvibacterium marinum]|uniref:class I lanthipeptide n=1 Tax=Ulvibacterium marinum TaxID=2419782 RepID=UPI001B876357